MATLGLFNGVPWSIEQRGHPTHERRSATEPDDADDGSTQKTGGADRRPTTAIMIDGPVQSPAPLPAETAPLIEVLDTDPATLALVREWLGGAGYRVLGEAPRLSTQPPPALAIIDVPFTRHGAADLLRRIGESHPGVPVLALSPTFFSNVRCDGNCARALGVAGVLPKPVTRDALLGAVAQILHSPR